MTKPGLAVRSTATTILTRVIDDGRGLDGLLDTHHGPASYRKLSQTDKSLVRAIATTAFRHRGEIDLALSKMLDRKLPKNARHLLHTLHVAAAQILFMEIPDSAAVDLAVSALNEEKRSHRFASLANAILRRMSREKDTLFKSHSAAELAILNMPTWLRSRTKKSYGRDRLATIAGQHMLEPVLDLSVKSDPQGWAEKLGGVHLLNNTIRINASGKVEDWEGYQDGEWWVQDAAAAVPATLFGDLKGKSALDLCAAPGGKTAQLANMGASVTALEASKPRLQRLEENMRRLKLEVESVNADLFEWQPTELFDAVLLDAPCSSTGTIRRHPDVQWTKSPEIVDGLAKLQKDMVSKAASFVKPGGTLVFANCSLDRAEGEDVYAQLLSADTELTPRPVTKDEMQNLPDAITGQGTVRTLPCHLQDIKIPKETNIDPLRFTGLDGFFAARFLKSD